MAITPIPVTIADLIPPSHLAQYTERSPGLHVSTVVRSLCSKLDPKRYPPVIGAQPHTNEMWELGLAFEDLLGLLFAERSTRHRHQAMTRPGEIRSVDAGLPGVALIGTPDWVAPWPTCGLRPIETKVSWLSTKHAPDGEKYAYFVWQIKTYMVMLGVLEGELWVLHINGDYKYDTPGPQPKLKPFEVTMTPTEAEEHWAMMQGEARRLVAAGVIA